MAVSYETAVYTEECDALALEIKAAIERATAHIGDARARVAIAAAAAVTAVQLVDEALIAGAGYTPTTPPKTVRLNGVAQKVIDIVADLPKERDVM